jgi:prefoldin subunit 5
MIHGLQAPLESNPMHGFTSIRNESMSEDRQKAIDFIEKERTQLLSSITRVRKKLDDILERPVNLESVLGEFKKAEASEMPE